MKSETQIRGDFRAACSRAEEIDRIAQDRGGVARRDMEGTLDDLSRAWRGESAQKFTAKTEKLQTDIQGDAKDLESIADAIRRAAKIMYDAEMEALRIARERARIKRELERAASSSK